MFDPIARNRSFNTNILRIKLHYLHTGKYQLNEGFVGRQKTFEVPQLLFYEIPGKFTNVIFYFDV